MAIIGAFPASSHAPILYPAALTAAAGIMAFPLMVRAIRLSIDLGRPPSAPEPPARSSLPDGA